MKIYYRDEDVLAEQFCKESNCSTCNGTDSSGEPNGYGCDDQEQYESDNFDNVISESDNNKKLFVEVDELLEFFGKNHDPKIIYSKFKGLEKFIAQFKG